jgi:PBP1b-binding outer membrane lipoprotein LpoB
MLARSLLTALSSIALLAGCASTGARNIDPGVEGIKTVGQIDIQDVDAARKDLIESLLKSGRLAEAPTQPPVIRIGKFINNTSTKLPPAILLDGIEAQLTNSGLAIVDTSSGSGAEAGIAQQERRRRQLQTGEMQEVPNDFELICRIEQLKTSAGDVKQAYYQFSMQLTALSGSKLGLQVWKDQKPITKQGTKPSIGF